MLFRRCIASTFAILSRKYLMGHKLLQQTSSIPALHQSVSLHNSYKLEPLTERSFIRVHGPDSDSFLQGLITNDIRHFEHSGAMYVMFLKANGRVFCDALIYKRPGAPGDDYMLECDNSIAPRLEKHLKLYRLKKKVQVTPEETFGAWVAFRDGGTNADLPSSDKLVSRPSVPNDGPKLHLFKDPRLARLGYRVLSTIDYAGTMEELYKIFDGATMTPSGNEILPYTAFRYSLGVGEGAENIPDGKCFPLESNCDYLHGVSFHKGCYIGQELTARTHHTGVIRKRLMPLEFEEPPILNVPPESLRDAEIKNREGAVVGKLRGLSGSHGIGLLRIEKVLPDSHLLLNVAGVADAIHCRTKKPFWWPTETKTRKVGPANPSSMAGTLQEKTSTSGAETSAPSITFHCELCGLDESCDYRGRQPPFAKKIELLEECYVMRDPFAPPPNAVPDKPSSEHYLILGADCNICRRTVCKANECSFFYGATFCRRCSVARVTDFPLEVRSKIKKQFS